MPNERPPLLIRIFASACFTGYAPIASGTVGSALAALFFLIPGFERWTVIIPASVVVYLLGILAGTRMERFYGHDPAEVTIDEVVGMWISLWFIPKSAGTVIAAFFLFRFTDIVKPYPARIFDRMHGGFGIMTDDVVAGIYANLMLQAILLLTPLRSFLL
jgi:phosphatidylglycerophosphatase A